MTPVRRPERPCSAWRARRARRRPRGAPALARALAAPLALAALAALVPVSAVAQSAPAGAQSAPAGGPARSSRGGRTGPAPDDTKVVARALANRGYALLKAGKPEEALEAFGKAEELFHAPTILLMIARTREKLGQLVEAEETYQRVAGEELPAYAPREFFEAQRSARAELALLSPRVPAVRIVVRGPRPQDARVTLDDAEVERSTFRPVNPGDHTVVANDGVRRPVKREVRLAEGQRQEVELQLGPLPRPPEPPPPARGSLVPGAVGIGLGVVGIGIGSVTGAMALSKASALADACPDRTCTRDREPEYQEARSLQTISIVGFVAGGAALAAGVTLLVLRPGGGPKPQPQAQTAVAIGPGWAGLRGSF